MRVVAVAVLALVFALTGCLKGIIGDDLAGPRDFVSSSDYTKWVIEVDTIEGMAPPASAMSLLEQRLHSVANKPDGIEIRTDDSLPARGGTWTLRDVTDYSSAHLDAQTDGKTAVLHLLFLDGSYDNSAILGVTISRVTDSGRVTSSGPIAIFSESIEDSCSGITVPPRAPCTSSTPIYGPVLIHEFGHAMGLVNHGIPMVRDHEADTCQNRPDEGHSSNPQSVMDCDVETSNILAAFPGQSVPTDYDADDRADICAAGGKCP